MEVWLHAEGDYLGAFPICGDFSAAATHTYLAQGIP